MAKPTLYAPPTQPPAGIPSASIELRTPIAPGSRAIPLLVATLLALTIGFALIHSQDSTARQITFALDDPYIHLAMARTLSGDGVWGVTPGDFSATSSAPLYTLLLAGLFLISGPTTLWAWLINIAAGLALAWILAASMQTAFTYRAIAVGAGLWGVVATGLPEVVFTGMEHTAHALVVLLLARELSRDPGSRLRTGPILVLAFAAGGLRYESLFLLPASFAVLLWRRKAGLAVLTALTGCLAPILLGIYQVWHGGYFLPNTVMLKGVVGTQGDVNYLERFLLQIDTGVIVPLVIALGTGVFLDIFFARGERAAHRVPGAALFLSASVFHMAFALNERRYVLYLVSLGIWALVPWMKEWLSELRRRLPANTRPSRRLWLAFGLALVVATVFPFSERFLDLVRVPGLGQDVYAQQQQMARFFSDYYSGETIALNDIGAVAWSGKNRILDIAGLAASEIAGKIINDEFTSDALHDIALRKGAGVAAIYPGWLVRFGGVPKEWRPVGAWLLDKGVQINVASPQIVFFATTPEAVEPLRRNLAAFAPRLPENVTFTPFM